MTMLRGACYKTIAIVLLVVAGFWYAEHPDLVTRYLSPAAPGNGSQDAVTSINRVAWSPDGDRLLTLATAAVGHNRPLVLHDLAHAGPGLPIDLQGENGSTLAISPDGRYALVGTFNGHLWWIGLETDERTTIIELAPPGAITSAAISRDGSWVAAADDNGRVLLCPVPPGAKSSSATNTEHCTDSPEGRSAARNVILAQDLRTSSCDIRFSESGDRLLWAGNNGSLRVWDLQTGTLLQAFWGEQRPITAAVFLPGDDRIMSAGLDDTIRIWSVASGREVWRGQFGFLGVTALALSPDGKTAAWGGYNRKILVWNVEQGRTEFVIETTASVIRDLRFSPDGKLLAAAGREGTIRLYDAKTGAEQQEIDVETM